MSSTMASAARNTFRPAGAPGATSASTPSAKAMSVAVGTAQPDRASGGGQRQVEQPPAPATPPRAAAKGSAAWRRLDSSPTSSSRLISRPTSRKNTAISPSLTQWRAVRASGGLRVRPRGASARTTRWRRPTASWPRSERRPAAAASKTRRRPPPRSGRTSWKNRRGRRRGLHVGPSMIAKSRTSRPCHARRDDAGMSSTRDAGRSWRWWCRWRASGLAAVAWRAGSRPPADPASLVRRRCGSIAAGDARGLHAGAVRRARRRRLPAVRQPARDVAAGYSYGISGYDGWGCDVATRRQVPVHQYDCFNLAQPACHGADHLPRGVRRQRAGHRSRDRSLRHARAPVVGNGDAASTWSCQDGRRRAPSGTPSSPRPTRCCSRIDQLVVEFHGTATGAGSCRRAPAEAVLPRRQPAHEQPQLRPGRCAVPGLGLRGALRQPPPGDGADRRAAAAALRRARPAQHAGRARLSTRGAVTHRRPGNLPDSPSSKSTSRSTYVE